MIRIRIRMHQTVHHALVPTRTRRCIPLSVLYEYNTRVSRACGYTGWPRNISKHLCFDTVQTFGIWIPSSNLFVRYLGKIVGLLVKKSVCWLNICVLWYMLRGMENLISILLKVFRIIKIKSWLGLYDYRKWGFLKNNISI